jgi:HSP20 family protein
MGGREVNLSMQLEVWDEMKALEHRFDDLFRGLLWPRGRFTFMELPYRFHGRFVPTADVFASNGDLVVRLELPGIDPAKDVTVTLEEGDLVIRGKREQNEEVKEEDFYRKESSYGAFERHVSVPKEVAEKDIEAAYKEGVLEIWIHGFSKELEGPKAKAIPIKTQA